MNSDTLYSGLTAAINFFVFAYFVSSVVKPKLIFPKWVIIGVVILLAGFSGTINGLFFSHNSSFSSNGLLVIVLWYVVLISTLKIISKTELTQILFILFVSNNIYNNIIVISSVLFKLTDTGLSESSGEFAFSIILLLLFFPSLFFLFRLFRQVTIETNKYEFWKLLWIIPAILCFIFVLNFAGSYWVLPREIGVFNLISAILWTSTTYIVYWVLLIMVNQTQRSMKALEHAGMLKKQIDMQKEQYRILSENIRNTARIRHDFRHHLLTIHGLSENGNVARLREYLDQYRREYYVEEDENPVCQNMSVNIILLYFAGIARERGIEVLIRTDIPEGLSVSDIDLCVVFGNLFENAVEACERQQSGRRYITIRSMIFGSQLLIEITNSYEVIHMVGEKFLSSKRDGEGMGISSARSIAERNGGMFGIYTGDNEFKVKVLINL